MTDRDRVFSLVVAELDRAIRKFEPFHSAHEGYAVILEELDEAWDEIKSNNPAAARREMIQVAAMALRFLVDLPVAHGLEHPPELVWKEDER